MPASKELVLYYNPASPAYLNRLKGVLVQMGVRIKTILPGQTGHQVGVMAGIKGLASQLPSEAPEITDEVLIMHGFTSRRIDQLLAALRKAGVPKIALKAVITETNREWTFAHLYEEIKKEHQEMSEKEVNTL